MKVLLNNNLKEISMGTIADGLKRLFGNNPSKKDMAKFVSKLNKKTVQGVASVTNPAGSKLLKKILKNGSSKGVRFSRLYKEDSVPSQGTVLEEPPQEVVFGEEETTND